MSTIAIKQYKWQAWDVVNSDGNVFCIPKNKNSTIIEATDYKGMTMTSTETWKILGTIGAAFVLGMLALWTVFDKLDTKIDRVEAKIEGKIDRVEAKIENIEKDVNTMKTDIHGIKVELKKR